jgi:hypothetical protein
VEELLSKLFKEGRGGESSSAVRFWPARNATARLTSMGSNADCVLLCVA